MNLRVMPDLEKIVATAKEAKIAIRDIHFVRNMDQDILEALSIDIDGNDDSKGYFTYLLARNNLKKEPVL